MTFFDQSDLQDCEDFFLGYGVHPDDFYDIFIEAASEFSVEPAAAPSQRSRPSKPSYFDDEIYGAPDVIADASVASEVSRYFAEAIEPRDTDPLAFWKSRQRTYPGLAAMARCFFAIPATSTPSERVFSKAKAIIGPQRSRLAPQSIEMLLCLKDWYATFGPMYIAQKGKRRTVIELDDD